MGFFENRYVKMCPDFTTDVEERRALRVNTLKITPAKLARRLNKKNVKLQKIPFVQDGYWYTADFSLGATPEYLQGHYYLQGAASQVVAEALTPQPGETVLDMAAAPGSKTTHLAQLMRNEGTIIALDSNSARLISLRNNCERLFVRNVVIIKKDARFATDLEMTFDRVLLDAPCSGNFCSEQGWFQKRSITDIQGVARTQRELLESAYRVLKRGGTLLYSICSLEPEEGELVLDWFLEKFPDMVLEPLEVGDPGITEWEGKALNPALSGARRFWPHKTQTEGFFVARVRKTVGKLPLGRVAEKAGPALKSASQ